MSGIIIRIALRWIAGALVARGLISLETSDIVAYDDNVYALADIGMGAVTGAIAEGWYYLARKLGWAT